MAKEEMLDVVDISDRVVGQMTYDEFYETGQHEGLLIRGAAAFIQNADSKLWIPRRVKTKRFKPNALDFSVAEHVGAGETYLEAVVRGFQEELNMKIKPSDLRPLGKINPSAKMRFFTYGYVLKYDRNPKYNEKDFYEFLWLSPHEVRVLITGGEDSKDAILPMLEFLQ